MRRSNWRILAACGVLAVVGAACSPSAGAGNSGSSKGSDNGGNVTLSVWGWRPEDTAAYKKIFDKFHEEHSNITVEYKPYKSTEYNTILSTGLTQAGGPDVMMLRAYGLLQPLVQAGDLVSLDDKIPSLSGFDQAALDGTRGRQDHKIYGVPTAMQTFQIYYNKDIFSKYGIDVPTTWDGMIAAAKKLKQNGVTPFACSGKDTWLLPLYDDAFAATRYGGPDFEQKLLSGQAKFTDPEYQAALQDLKELQPYFPDGMMGMGETDVQTLFATGKAAMMPEGSFALAPTLAIKPDLNLGVFDAPPTPDAAVDHPLEVGWVDMSFGVNAKSPHQQQALELVKWMASQEFGQMYVDNVKQLSLVPGVHPTDPLLASMLENYRAHPTPYLMLVDFRYGQPLGSDLEAQGLQNMLLGKQTAAQVSQDIQKGVSQWFTPSKG